MAPPYSSASLLWNKLLFMIEKEISEISEMLCMYSTPPNRPVLLINLES